MKFSPASTYLPTTVEDLVKSALAVFAEVVLDNHEQPQFSRRREWEMEPLRTP